MTEVLEQKREYLDENLKNACKYQCIRKRKYMLH